MDKQEEAGAQRRPANEVSNKERIRFLRWLAKQDHPEITETKDEALLAVWETLLDGELDSLVIAWRNVTKMMDDEDDLIEELLVATCALVDTKMEGEQC